MSKFESLVRQYSVILNEDTSSSKIDVLAPKTFYGAKDNKVEYKATGFDYDESNDEIRNFYNDLKAFIEKYANYINMLVAKDDPDGEIIQNGLRVMWSSIYKE